MFEREREREISNGETQQFLFGFYSASFEGTTVLTPELPFMPMSPSIQDDRSPKTPVIVRCLGTVLYR